MSQEQIEEANLSQRWRNSVERKMLEEYAGEPIGNVPEEYRECISKMREYGYGLKKKGRTGKEIAQASIGSLTDIGMIDREGDALRGLVEKAIEGGIKPNEQS